ncbi:MAG TPA: hypothetical protein VH391_08000 [Solirubrobacterales bacterium]
MGRIGVRLGTSKTPAVVNGFSDLVLEVWLTRQAPPLLPRLRR